MKDKNTYYAHEHVQLGKPDEHAYNLTLSVVNILQRLIKWKKYITWQEVGDLYTRSTFNMRVDQARRQSWNTKKML